MPRTRHLAGVVPSPRAIRWIVICKISTSRHVVKLLVGELLLFLIVFCFHNRNVLKLMIELISAAKVGKISETDVSLPEKVVSNQEKFQVPWQIGTCPVADSLTFMLYLNITLLRQHSVVASLQMRMQNSLSAVCSR